MQESSDYKYTRSKPCQARGRKTVRAIMAAASKHFMAGDIHTVTTNEIAKTAVIPVGLVYRYFENREAIVLAVVSEHMHELALGITSCGERPDFMKLDWYDICRTVLITSSKYLEQNNAGSYLFAYRGSPRLRATLAEDRRLIWMAYVGLLSRRSGFDPSDKMVLRAATVSMTMLYSVLDLSLEDLSSIGTNYTTIIDDAASTTAAYLSRMLVAGKD